MSSSKENLNDGILSAMALTYVVQSQNEAVLALLEEMCRRAGTMFGPNSDQSARQVYDVLRAEFLQRRLVMLEDKNPALSAKIQGMIDGASA